MFSKLSQDALFSPQHLDPTLLPPGQFQGSESYEEIIKLRDRVINSLRQKQIIKYLENPLDKLLPDPRKYGQSYAEERKLEEDTEKKKAEAGQAYAMVNAIFKPGSAAHAVIRESEATQDLPLLWKLFTDHYLSYSTVQDAIAKMKKFFEKPATMDTSFTLVGAFLALQDLIYDFEVIDPHSTFVPSATGRERSSDFLTPHRTERERTRNSSNAPRTPTTPGLSSRPTSTKFPEYIWVLQVLLQIQLVPHLRAPMQKFLKEKVFNNRHLTIGKVKAASVLTLLRDFEKQESITAHTFAAPPQAHRVHNTLSSRDYELADAAADKVLEELDKNRIKSHATQADRYYCARHGPNSSHTTSSCRALLLPVRDTREHEKHYANRRQFKWDKSAHYSNSPRYSRSDSRDRSRSPSLHNFEKNYNF
jgi:hypothetical protein